MQLLDNAPQSIGLWMLWEPNAFDGNDNAFRFDWPRHDHPPLSALHYPQCSGQGADGRDGGQRPRQAISQIQGTSEAYQPDYESRVGAISTTCQATRTRHHHRALPLRGARQKGAGEFPGRGHEGRQRQDERRFGHRPGPGPAAKRFGPSTRAKPASSASCPKAASMSSIPGRAVGQAGGQGRSAVRPPARH